MVLRLVEYLKEAHIIGEINQCSTKTKRELMLYDKN